MADDADVGPTRARVRIGRSVRALARGRGASATDADASARPLSALRFDFCARNADESKRARVFASDDGAVEITYDAVDDGGGALGREVKYRGMRVEREVGGRARRRDAREDGELVEDDDDVEYDCALVYDDEVGEWVLERVASTVGSLRIAREATARTGAGERGDAATDARERRERASRENEVDAATLGLPSTPRKK